ncbi:MAG: ParA family protein [Ruminiclostridium sp.]|nr:ParA family protein [Ruminiclostridium sp.]
MQVSFWSNSHQLGTTQNMAAIAVLTALEYRLRVLMAHTHFDRSSLESAFIEKRYMRDQLTDLSDSGIDALSRFVRFNRVDKDVIAGFSTTILKNKLDLLFGTRNTNREIFFSNLKPVIGTIVQSASAGYDLVLIDTAPGNNDISAKILEQSDLIIVNLSQNIHILEDFLGGSMDYRDKMMILLGKYDANSRFNLKAIRKKAGNIPVLAVPYDISFADACAESRVVDFFMKNLTVERDDPHFPFMMGVREAAEAILARLGFETETKRGQAGIAHE